MNIFTACIYSPRRVAFNARESGEDVVDAVHGRTAAAAAAAESGGGSEGESGLRGISGGTYYYYYYYYCY